MKFVTHTSLGGDCRCKPIVCEIEDEFYLFHHIDRISQVLGMAEYRIIWQRMEAMA